MAMTNSFLTIQYLLSRDKNFFGDNFFPYGRIQVYLVKIPEGLGCFMQKRHWVMGKVYRNEGPNVARHADGYDKNSQTGHGDNSVYTNLSKETNMSRLYSAHFRLTS